MSVSGRISNRFGLRRIFFSFAALLAVVASLVFSHAISHLTWGFLFAVILLQPLSILSLFFIAWRLSYLAGPSVNIWSAAKAISLSVLVLYILPSRLSEFVKPLYLAERCAVPASRALAAVVCERLSDLFIMALAVTAAVTYLANDNLRSILPYWLSVATAVVVFCASFILRPRLFEKLIALLPWSRVKPPLSQLLQQAGEVLTLRSILPTLFLGALGWSMSFFMTFCLLALAGSKPVDPGNALIVFLAGTLGYVVGLAPGGLGTFEGAVVVSLGFFGYGAGEALALAIAMRISNLPLPGVLALTVLMREHTGLGAFARRIRVSLQNFSGQESPSGSGDAGG